MQCNFKFQMPGRPREYCGLPVIKDGRCCLHTRGTEETIAIDLIKSEIKKKSHWLEGIYLPQNINNLNLSGANMPRANFEGCLLKYVIIKNANLESAIFSNSILYCVSFNDSNLKKARFVFASFEDDKRGGWSVDLRGADIGGSDFTSAKLENARLESTIFSRNTDIKRFLDFKNFEENNEQWDAATSIYTAMSRAAIMHGDIISEDTSNYFSMSCRHRKMINAGQLRSGFRLNNWVLPSLKAGLNGIWWLLQRVVWGYGYKPGRLLVSIPIIVSLFVFPILLYCDISLTQAFMLSAKFFLGIGINSMSFQGTFLDIIAIIEGFMGAIFLSLFVVSLSARYFRKN